MKKTAAVLLPLILLGGCESATGPLPLLPGEPVEAISDGANDGLEGFYFLPPMVKAPTYAGTFDLDLEPVVEICENPACETLHAAFSMSDGAGSELVRLDELDEHFIVNWHTDKTAANVGQTYRVRVKVGELVLGYADIEMAENGREARNMTASETIGLLDGRTLPVKFRIETGIVGAVVVSPAEATIDVGATQQFTAAVQDLHGKPLVGPTVTWSSGDQDIATVDASGLATGLAEGEATITASAGLASGSATLTVTGSAVAAGWYPMGSGMNDRVNALVIHDGRLIAGGAFTAADGVVTHRIARLNGSEWEPMGGGMNNVVQALIVHDGVLIAAGDFTSAGGQTRRHIARWDGTEWQPLGTGMSDRVLALAVYNGELIAGGYFTSADGRTVNHVARWDGVEWLPLGAGITSTAINVRVQALTVHDGSLVVGGAFTQVAGITTSGIARWDGSEWHAIGGGTNGSVFALTIHDGHVVAGGGFTSAGGVAASRVARWNGSAWQPMGSGLGERVFSLSVHGGAVVAGGFFPSAIRRWDGASWLPIGEGMTGGTLASVEAVVTHGGGLVAGGRFQMADGVPANNIARWGTP